MKISQILSLSLSLSGERRNEVAAAVFRGSMAMHELMAEKTGAGRCWTTGSSSITGEGDAHGLARAAWMASASGLGNMMIENDEKNRYCGIFL
jgi:hypothetical protein